jgi:hypothetical protein
MRRGIHRRYPASGERSYGGGSLIAAAWQLDRTLLDTQLRQELRRTLGVTDRYRLNRHGRLPP